MLSVQGLLQRRLQALVSVVVEFGESDAHARHVSRLIIIRIVQVIVILDQARGCDAIFGLGQRKVDSKRASKGEGFMRLEEDTA